MRTFAATAAAVLLCLACLPSAAPAAVERDGLVFSGRKVFSYEGSRDDRTDAALATRFDQAFQFAVRGDLTERVRADLRFDDTKRDKVERMEFRGDFAPFTLTVGDFAPPGRVEALSAAPLRGLSARFDGDDAAVDLFVSRPATPLLTARLAGDGTRGPYFLPGGGIEPETETVLVRSIRRYKNADYVVDYGSGALEFLEPVPSGDPIEAVYRSDAPDPTRADLLVGVGSTLERGGRTLDLSLLRRESGMPGEESAHTLLDLGQKVPLGAHGGLEARVSQTMLETPGGAASGDRSLSLAARRDLGPAGLTLRLRDTGPGYRPLFATGDTLGRRVGLTLDRPEGPLRPSLSLERIAGDGMPGRDELNGGVAYAPDPRVSLRGECRLRRPDDGRDGSDLLARLATDLTLPGVRVESRASLQDDLALFQPERGVNRLADSEWRVSTAPAKRTVALLDLRDRGGTDSAGAATLALRDRTVKLLHKIDRRTHATMSGGEVRERGAGAVDQTRRDGSLGLTRRLSPRATLDAELRASGGDGPYAVSGQGGTLGLRSTLAEGLTLNLGAGYRDVAFVRIAERATLGSGEMRLVYAPERAYTLELSGRREEVGFDAVTGLPAGDRTSLGGRFGVPLGPRGKASLDLSALEDAAPARRRTLVAGTELSVRLRPEVQLFLDFRKQSVELPDVYGRGEGSARGGFRLEAQL